MPVQIYGIQAAQAAMLRAANAARPGNAMDAAVKDAGAAAHRYAVGVTHVDTGALKAAHRLRVAGSRAEIYIDPGATRSDGRRPAQYGPYEHERGGVAEALADVGMELADPDEAAGMEAFGKVYSGSGDELGVCFVRDPHRWLRFVRAADPGRGRSMMETGIPGVARHDHRRGGELGLAQHGHAL